MANMSTRLPGVIQRISVSPGKSICTTRKSRKPVAMVARLTTTIRRWFTFMPQRALWITFRMANTHTSAITPVQRR
ncbi:hypothetical protein D9M68_785890 [compost metagenome]